jgi:hypothetical protein
MAVAFVGLVFVGQAVAGLMAFRITALGCITRPSSFFKFNTPAGAPGDWGVYNNDSNNSMTIYCPLPLDSSAGLDINQTVNSVSMVTGGPGTVTCAYNLIEHGAGTLTSVDVSGDTTDVTIPAVFKTNAPGNYQLATANLNRHLFVCTLPMANQTASGTTSRALLRALEVNYGIASP